MPNDSTTTPTIFSVVTQHLDPVASGDGTYVLVDPLDLWAPGTIANRESANEHE